MFLGDHKAEVLNHEPLTDLCKTESHWLSRVAILLVMLFGMNILVYSYYFCTNLIIGWKTIRGALVMPLMIEGFQKGVIKFLIITCKKPE